MKTILLILILVAAAAISNSQTFAPLGATWHYSASAGGSGPPRSEYYLYQAELDTFVAGHSCMKISVTYYKHSGAVDSLAPVFTYQTGDTVFYYNSIYSKYYPLYIFNVSPGDTLTFHAPNIPYYPDDTLWQSVVDSVTDFIVGTDTLQRVWARELYPSAYSLWGGYIEKLGSPFLMLHQPHSVYPEWDGPMRCYSDSSISYNFSSRPCDYLLTDGINKLEKPFELSLFPNPTTNQLNIKTKFDKPFHFNIYNSSGQLVKMGFLQFGLTTISLENLCGGIYSIELKADNKIERQSFLVEK